MYIDLNYCTLPVNRNCIIVMMKLPSDLFILLSVMHVHKAECKCYFDLCFLYIPLQLTNKGNSNIMDISDEIYKISLYIFKSSTHEETSEANVRSLLCVCNTLYLLCHCLILKKIITFSKIKT